MTITPLIYGIEKGFYRHEGVDLQFRILRGDLAISAMLGSREAIEFIGRKFALAPPVAEETYKVVLQTLSEDGTVGQQVLEELLEQVKKEAGVKREMSVGDIVDYRMLSEVAAWKVFNLDGNIPEDGLRLVIDQAKRALKMTREVSPSEAADTGLLREAQRELGIIKSR